MSPQRASAKEDYMRNIVGIDPYEINQVYGIISFLPVEKQAMIIYGWIASVGEGTEAIYSWLRHS